MFTIYLKSTTGGEKIPVNVDNETTIAEVKAAAADKAEVPAENQRLIYKGQVLKDDRTIESYGLASDHVLHLVRSRPAGLTSAPASAAPTAATSMATPAPAAALGGGMGLGGLGASPEMMQQVMNSPLMQSMMNDPELMRSMLSQNPAISQMMERNPDFAQVLNNPQLLRESMQLASNPVDYGDPLPDKALMREAMRNTDRAFNNIESHPEGFNMLRRMYENVQEPLMDAMADDAANASLPGGNTAGAARNGANPFAQLFGGASVPATSAPAASAAPAAPGSLPVPNTSPLPNPWAPSSAQPTGPAGVPPMGLGAGGGLGELPGFGAMPGLGQGQGGDMASLMQAMQNPAMQQAMQAMLANPGTMESLANAAASSNPQLRQMMDADPRLRQMLTDPDMVRRTLDPANMQAMMQMQAAMQQLQASGLLPAEAAGAGGLGGLGGMPGAAGGLGGQDYAQLMNSLRTGGAMGGLMGGGPAAAPDANPEATYATQLEQLQGMGFYDTQANIRALQATGGNVSAAVDRLLQQM